MRSEKGKQMDAFSPDPDLSNAELVQLRVRVVALENLLITLLAQNSEQQLGRGRDMAAYISPRPGHTDHPLTVHAAAQMLHLTQRAVRLRGSGRTASSYTAWHPV